MNKENLVVALCEDANIYMVLDESGRTIGTGTREVCEMLANLTMRASAPAKKRGIIPVSKDNIRSAITIY